VAFCSAVLFAITLLILPFVVAALGRGSEPFALYALVFSKWGAGAIGGAFLIGFAIGSERMAEFFSFMWGTHPFWKKVEYWFHEHENLGVFLIILFMIGLVALFY
jgi:hypothetical protein